MKYLLTVTLTGILAVSTLGFAETYTPNISDLKIVNEQVAPDTANPDPSARHRGYRYRSYRHRGYRHHGYRYRSYRHRAFFFFGNQPEGSGGPESLPSPQVE